MMTKRSMKSRIEKLEKAINPETRRPTYISVTNDQWDQLQAGDLEPGDLGIEKQKVFVGISPDDWDNQVTDPAPD